MDLVTYLLAFLWGCCHLSCKFVLILDGLALFDEFSLEEVGNFVVSFL